MHASFKMKQSQNKGQKSAKQNKNKQPNQQKRKHKNKKKSYGPQFRSQRAPISQQTSVTGGAAKVTSTKEGNFRIKQTEFIGNISTDGSGAWSLLQTFAVNPGLPRTFPWLSSIANQFELYQFHKLSFMYVTRTNTVASGSVQFAFDYDAADLPPTDESRMLTFLKAQEFPPYEERFYANASIPAMHNTLKKHYVRNTDVANTDIKTYDVANFFIAAFNGNGAANWGSLWVNYDVELSVPQLNSPPPKILVQGTPIGSPGPLAARYLFNDILKNAAYANPLSVILNSVGAGTVKINGSGLNFSSLPVGQYVGELAYGNVPGGTSLWSMLGGFPSLQSLNNIDGVILNNTTDSSQGTTAANRFTQNIVRWLMTTTEENGSFDVEIPQTNTAGNATFDFSLYPITDFTPLL